MKHLDLRSLHHTPGKSDLPSHTGGTRKGEEWVKHKGREPGRDAHGGGHTSRDSTGINASHHDIVDPKMPHMPPA